MASSKPKKEVLMKKGDPSDLSDAEGEFIRADLTKTYSKKSRPPKHSKRALLNAIFTS
jgi:transposase